jgi:protein-S-isoprenylcysteine O-methyltransferase Ste14
MLIVRKFLLTPAWFDCDLLEKLVLIIFLSFMAFRMIPVVIETATYQNTLLLVSETVVVLFIVFRRRTTAISHRTSDWLIGFAGAFAPLLSVPALGEPIVPIGYCGMLMLGGFCLQMSAKLTLRRSFGVIAANRRIKISGPYRLVRHPMYAGYTLTYLGFLLSGPNFWNFGLYSFTFGLFVMRILAEEHILQQDPAYQLLSAKVPYRLVPFVF